MIKTICFLGDSITANGTWEAEIFEKARHDKIRFYNCGVSGSNATSALERLYYMGLEKNPDMVSIMFGVNDNNCGYYYNKEREPGQLEREKKEAEERFELYKNSMRTLCEKVKQAGAELVLCTPVPFDNVTPGEMEKDLSIPLDKAVPYIKELAEEFGAKIVDFNGEMKKHMEKECIFKPDRVHPNDRGYRLMAEIWSNTMFDGKYAVCADDEYVVCEKLAKRNELEHILHNVRLIEYCFLGTMKSKKDAKLAERIAAAEEGLKKAQAGGYPRAQTEVDWYSTYLDYIDNLDKLEGEYTRLTIELTEE